MRIYFFLMGKKNFSVCLYAHISPFFNKYLVSQRPGSTVWPLSTCREIFGVLSACAQPWPFNFDPNSGWKLVIIGVHFQIQLSDLGSRPPHRLGSGRGSSGSDEGGWSLNAFLNTCFVLVSCVWPLSWIYSCSDGLLYAWCNVKCTLKPGEGRAGVKPQTCVCLSRIFTNNCSRCYFSFLPSLTCTSAAFLFSYWAERLGEWWAWPWPWAALASMQVWALGGGCRARQMCPEQKHTDVWVRSLLLVTISDQSWWIWLLLACLSHKFPQTCCFCFYKL